MIFCWPWGPVCGSVEAAITESPALLLHPSWLVSSGTSAPSGSSHSATDKLSTRYTDIKSDTDSKVYNWTFIIVGARPLRLEQPQHTNLFLWAICCSKQYNTFWEIVDLQWWYSFVFTQRRQWSHTFSRTNEVSARALKSSFLMWYTYYLVGCSHTISFLWPYLQQVMFLFQFKRFDFNYSF